MNVYIKRDDKGIYRPADTRSRKKIRKDYVKLKDIIKLQENNHNVLVVSEGEVIPNSIQFLEKIKQKKRKAPSKGPKN